MKNPVADGMRRQAIASIFRDAAEPASVVPESNFHQHALDSVNP